MQSVKQCRLLLSGGWCLLLKLCKSKSWNVGGKGWVSWKRPCSTHISKASLESSSVRYLNSWRVGCLPSSQYFPVWRAGTMSAKNGEKQGSSEAAQLQQQCSCSLCVQLQQVLPSWVFEHRTSVVPAHSGHLVGSQESPMEGSLWCLGQPEWRHGVQEGHICSIQHSLVLWSWEKMLFRKALLKRQHCLPPSCQAKCPLRLHLLSETVTEAHQNFTAKLKSG